VNITPATINMSAISRFNQPKKGTLAKYGKAKAKPKCVPKNKLNIATNGEYSLKNIILNALIIVYLLVT
tara:strand:+ start:702 stop:908 length:207 start_codon:yes stop_codon:yes gene_type:complete